MLATAFISLWISNTATTVMMFPIGMAVRLKFSEQRAFNHPDLRAFRLAVSSSMKLPCSMESTPAREAASMPSLPCAWAVTLQPKLWAVSTMDFIFGVGHLLAKSASNVR